MRSAVGSEFVEMFAGVAAARVNNLFMTARKRSPAIIFIDEIDAIGRARSAQGGDPGSMERESALLAMLVQMDGIHGKLEQVCGRFRRQQRYPLEVLQLGLPHLAACVA